MLLMLLFGATFLAKCSASVARAPIVTVTHAHQGAGAYAMSTSVKENTRYSNGEKIGCPPHQNCGAYCWGHSSYGSLVHEDAKVLGEPNEANDGIQFIAGKLQCVKGSERDTLVRLHFT